MPCGMNRIAAINTAPVVALPASARSPLVNAYNSAVITVAPTAGPAQWRVPPSTLIRMTVSGTLIENTSAVVTY